MGKKRGRGGKGRGEKRRKQWDGESATDGREQRDRSYRPWFVRNELFEAFYKAQGLVPEGEWDEFMEALKRRLPTTFRINGTGAMAEKIRNLLQEDILPGLQHVEKEDGTIIPPPSPLPWYPDNLGWHYDVFRSDIRKLPQLHSLFEFLKRETDRGAVSRQEAVSMIPPFFMDVKSYHRVLDMCAAPGSKTAQLLEMLSADTEPSKIEGFVVANDMDVKRAYLLVHQVQRLREIYPNIILTNHDATQFPRMILPRPDGQLERMTFDRILCDVMCTGDGTFRKSPDLWQRWTPNLAYGLHRMQMDVALRGCSMLSSQGRLVYSTCSLNPVEDEAVVAEVLRRTEGTMELVDCSGDMPGLLRDAGVSSWVVMDNKGALLDSYDEAVRSAMFPPTPEEAEHLHLDRCMRFLPHKQDTGGFFVAVLRKVARGAGPSVQEDEAAEAAKDATVVGATDKIIPWRGRGTPDESFSPVDTAIVARVFDFYGLDPAVFPLENFYCRSSDEKKDKQPSGDAAGGEGSSSSAAPSVPNKLVYVSTSVKRVLDANSRFSKFRVVNSGLRFFEKRGGDYMDCDYRITQESLGLVLPHMSRRKILLGMDDFNVLLTERSVRLNDFSEEGKARAWAVDGGGAVVVLEDAQELPVFKKEFGCKFFSLAVLRSKWALNLMVSVVECQQIRDNLSMFFPELAEPKHLPPRPETMEATAPAGEEDVTMEEK